MTCFSLWPELAGFLLISHGDAAPSILIFMVKNNWDLMGFLIGPKRLLELFLVNILSIYAAFLKDNTTKYL